MLLDPYGEVPSDARSVRFGLEWYEVSYGLFTETFSRAESLTMRQDEGRKRWNFYPAPSS